MAISEVSSGFVVKTGNSVLPAQKGSPGKSGSENILNSLSANLKQDKSIYSDPDWYVQGKIKQLRFQLNFYSKLGNLVSPKFMDSVEAEIKSLLRRQQVQFKHSSVSQNALMANFKTDTIRGKAIDTEI